jgi:hypothetical protein
VICLLSKDGAPPPVDLEQKGNYVLFLFNVGESPMIRWLVEEAAALTSLALFLGMVVIWAQLIATL